MKKDPGIPNLFPYKDKIIQEIEESRRLKAEENARRRELARDQKQTGEATTGTLDGEEELADEDELVEEESDNEDSMQVVRTFTLRRTYQ
jgi:nuclear GTP-binding protein